MRDSSLSQWMAEQDFELTGKASTTYLYNNVLSHAEATAIDMAASLAFCGRWGEAEHQRMKAGYDGLGLVDDGAIAYESESARENFRKALDSE